MREELTEQEGWLQQFEQERAERESAFVEECDRRQEWDDQDVADRIEAGLIDAEKLGRYLDLHRGRIEEVPAAPPEAEPEVVLAAERAFNREIRDYRAWLPGPGPGSGGCRLYKPYWSGFFHASAGAEAHCSGTHAEFKASALGDTLYTQDGSGHSIIKTVVVNSGRANTVFAFKVPPSCIPAGGGRMRATSTWSLFGTYGIVGMPSKYYKNYMAQLWVAAWTGINVVGRGNLQKRQSILEEIADHSTGGRFEVGRILKRVAMTGPVVESDVPPGHDVYVNAALEFHCAAGGRVPSSVAANFAGMDFATGSFGADLEEIRIEWVPEVGYLDLSL